MSAFSIDDVVSFCDEPSILATIQSTPSEVEEEASSSDFYFHESLSAEVKESWSRRRQLQPGYVLVGFPAERDRSCLVSETSIQLVDRPFTVGDVVKRRLSDYQSGIVVSTSIKCGIRSCFSRQSYEKPDRSQTRVPATPMIEVCASQLKAAQRWRERDYIIYEGWIGQIVSVWEAVTIRLSDGGVVVVDDPDDLKYPCYEKDAVGLHLFRRLQDLGYRPTDAMKAIIDQGSVPAYEALHPGMVVRTQRLNLKNGDWKRGTYNAGLRPYGIIVDVQCESMDIDWKFPNIFHKHTTSEAPKKRLDLEQIQSARMQAYDRNKLAPTNLSNQLPGAVYSPDVDLGLPVVFRQHDVPNAIDTKDHSRIDPRQTCGYDMNIYQVVQTKTQAMIQWQDGSISTELAASLNPYANIDDQDLWPGDLVFRGPAPHLGWPADAGFNQRRETGIVQSVNSKERLACIRWYKNPISESNTPEGPSMYCFGPIGDEIEQVSLYDLNNEPPYSQSRGNMVLILPELPHLLRMDLPWSPFRSNQLASSWGDRIQGLVQSAASKVASCYDLLPNSLRLFQAQELQDGSMVDTAASFGEIVDLCLDGDAIIRLGATTDAREMKVSQDRVLLIADANDEEDTIWENETDSRSLTSVNTLDSADVASVDFIDDLDYDVGLSNNEPPPMELWLDEDEMLPSNPSKSSTGQCEQASADPSLDNIGLTSGHHPTLQEAAATTPAYNADSLPHFSVLETPAPLDHHYLNRTEPLSKEQLRRIAGEQHVLASSLPDNVYVRAWESRLDLLRILLIGPQGTPYQSAPFVLDMYLGATYPATPPMVYFHSWTKGAGRINPNLYEDGKVCLSLLGTWHTQRRSEGWTTKSTLLQVIISVLGLVLVREPYFNEAGYEVLQGTPDSVVPSAMYSERAYIISKSFVKTALMSPPGCLEDVIQWLYVSSDGPMLLSKVVRECSQLRTDSRDQEAMEGEEVNKYDMDWAAGKLSAGALLSLKNDLNWLIQYAKEQPSAVDVEQDAMN